MGVSGQDKTLFKLKGLSIQNLKRIASSMESALTIDVDINWLVYYICRGLRNEEIIRIVADFLATLASSEFIVTPICDGFIRHHSKRASISRIQTREQTRIDSTRARFEAMKISRLLKDNPNDDSLRLELEDKNKAAKKGESASWSGIKDEFAEELSDFLRDNNMYDLNIYSGRIMPVIRAMFQADTVLSYRSIKKQSSFIPTL